MADPVDGARSLRPPPISVGFLPSLQHSYMLAKMANGTGRRAGHQIWRMRRRTKIRPKQLRPVNTSCVRQAKPTTRVRMKHGSKRGQKLKSTLGMRSGMIQIYLEGMSSVGRRTVNALDDFDCGCR